jgi:hypothetical protein
MYTDPLTGETWRFCVIEDEHLPVPTITRGRVYRLPSDWTTDSWRHYWDGGSMVAFIDGGYRDGTYAIDGTDPEQTERAVTAYRYSGEEALQRLAPRLTGNADSVFVVVGLDRGVDCYALAWSGENANEWRDEIEAVWHGDIWRIEVEEYAPGRGPGGSDWVSADEVPEEYYGESKAEAGFKREFPLDSFPAELLVTSTD